MHFISHIAIVDMLISSTLLFPCSYLLSKRKRGIGGGQGRGGGVIDEVDWRWALPTEKQVGHTLVCSMFHRAFARRFSSIFQEFFNVWFSNILH